MTVGKGHKRKGEGKERPQGPRGHQTRAGLHGIPSHLRSICAILAAKNMEVETSYPFTHDPKS